MKGPWANRQGKKPNSHRGSHRLIMKLHKKEDGDRGREGKKRGQNSTFRRKGKRGNQGSRVGGLFWEECVREVGEGRENVPLTH